MKKYLILFCLAFMFSGISYSSVKLGTVMSSSSSGRVIPGILFGIESDNNSASIAAVGWKNTLGYMSSYQVNYHALFNKGVYQAGIGWGILYTQMGFKVDLDHKGTTRVDVATGPTFRSALVFSWGFIQLDFMFGLRPNFIINHVLLSTQDSVQLGLGMRF